MNNKLKVLIAVPTYENIKPACFKSIYGQEGGPYMFDYVTGYGIAQARNKVVKEAIDYKFDWLLTVDSDVVLPRDAVKKLLAADKSFIYGWHPRKRSKHESEIFKFTEKDFTDRYTVEELTELAKEDKPFEIKGGGLGCALLYVPHLKAILEKEGTHLFKYVEYDNGTVLSEDNYFATVLARHSHKIYCLPSVRCGHVVEYTD